MRPRTSWAGVLLGSLLLSGCGFLSHGAFNPAGPNARRQINLFYISFWTSVVVYIIVAGLLFYAMLHRKRRAEPQETPRWDNRFVAIGGLIVPSVILMTMLVFTSITLAREPQRGDFRINVVAHQFWWEVYYPDQRFETANEIHIPVGRQIELHLDADDVIHSFWVPELSGKQDTVPGRENVLVLQADRPGVYRGQCAEYCGVQHANMILYVIADQPADFATWLAGQSRPAAVRNARGEQIFERQACAGCHTIRGTRATGEFGPDLTHLGSRETLASGMIPNDRGHLGGFVVNAQQVKPGVLMPPVPTLEPEELQALLDYLESLK